VLLDLDVVVEPHPAFLALGENLGLGRQRLENRALQLTEKCAAARTEVSRHAVIDLRDQFGDDRVQCREREEWLVAQLGDDTSEQKLAELALAGSEMRALEQAALLASSALNFNDHSKVKRRPAASPGRASYSRRAVIPSAKRHYDRECKSP
jgi:hypothetical protein